MSTNDFMIQLQKMLMEKKYGKELEHTLSESTAQNYIRLLIRLNGDKPFRTLAFLKKTETIMPKLLNKEDGTPYSDSSQRTNVASVASVLSLWQDKAGYKKCYKIYSEKLEGGKKTETPEQTATKTKKQEENWLTWEEVIKTRNELKEKCCSYLDKKTLTDAEYNHLLSYVVLSLYTDVLPRRNQDYLDMVIYNTTKKSKLEELPKDKNYLIVSNGTPMRFIYNVYKTAKTYGQQTIEIPGAVAGVDTPSTALLIYLKFHPQRKEKKEFAPFLVAREGPFTAQNAITRILNRVFKKKIGSSMLRHIYLSSKYDVAERNATAEGMAHSPALQHKYLKAETVEVPVEPTPPEPPLPSPPLKKKRMLKLKPTVDAPPSPPPPSA
jgi:hypothetical protein